MKRDEVSKLLTMVSALDRQPVDEGMVEMWLRVLGDYSFEACEQALIPAYTASKSGFVTAKAIYDRVSHRDSAPTPRGWVSDMHDIGEHWECRAGEFGCK
jgi:hypothetical protein